MLVLGIETSCDETGLALYDGQRGLLGHVLYSQAEIHNDYGGVVPELASRNHIQKLIPVLADLLKQHRLALTSLDGIAYTRGPGLVGALLAGVAFGRSLAWSLGIPSVGVHHMEGHLLAPMLETPAPEFPFVALLVSGGHTQLVEVKGIGVYTILGESLDDAAGEAFDKTAQLLGLGYPGGPALAALAEKGDPKRFSFPRPMLDRQGLDFSFSGLKTYALNTIQKMPVDVQTHADIARSFEEAVVDVLSNKSLRALKQTGLNRLVIAGGVGANRRLRARLMVFAAEKKFTVFYPRTQFCTDNGAMIALVGCLRLQRGQFDRTLSISATARWPLETLVSINDL